MVNRSSSHYPDIGVLGEDLVAQWLQSSGWIILQRRWCCRWGEIDVIAQQQSSPSSLIAFIEVKTRSQGSWDAGGLLAITPQKQAKLWRTAQSFLATYPSLVNHPCRFDVALVCHQRRSLNQQQPEKIIPPLGRVINQAGDYLFLQEYIPAAFE